MESGEEQPSSSSSSSESMPTGSTTEREPTAVTGTSSSTTATTTSTTTTADTGSSSEGSTSTGLDASSSGDSTTTGVVPGEPYFASLVAVIAPSTPFQFIGSIAADDATITMSLTPLSLDAGSVDTPREEVPPPLEMSGTVDVDGTFTIEALDVMIPGAANPITGSDIVVDISIEGSFVGDLVCAQVSGMVSSPAAINLLGSSFGAMPLPEETGLPLPDDIDCP